MDLKRGAPIWCTWHHPHGGNTSATATTQFNTPLSRDSSAGTVCGGERVRPL
jgi:hypothetical protein